jgi:hypothetical protein
MTGPRLDALTQAIAHSIALHQGLPRIDDDALVAHGRAIMSLEPPRRVRVGEELVALAAKVVATQKDAWEDTLVQLSLLIAVAVGGFEAAHASLSSALGDVRARALIASVSSSVPVGSSARIPGALSPTAAFLAHLTIKTPRSDQ